MCNVIILRTNFDLNIKDYNCEKDEYGNALEINTTKECRNTLCLPFQCIFNYFSANGKNKKCIS